MPLQAASLKRPLALRAPCRRQYSWQRSCPGGRILKWRMEFDCLVPPMISYPNYIEYLEKKREFIG